VKSQDEINGGRGQGNAKTQYVMDQWIKLKYTGTLKK
jgi:hypothetical protein